MKHMSMVVALEEEFDINFDEEITEMLSIKLIIETLKMKLRI